MQEVVVAATKLKDEGNACFAGGDAEACVKKYVEAASLLEAALAKDSSADGGARKLLATVHSNSANAHLTLQRWQEASDAASRAIAVLDEPAADGETLGAREVGLSDKARFRRASAEHQLGYAFSGLVDLLRVRVMSADVESLMRKLANAVGVQEVDRAFAIEPFSGGFSGVAREAIPPGATLFVEAQLVTTIDAEASPEGGDESEAPEATTESLVLMYSKQLQELRRGSEENVARYERVRQEMKGSWPRTAADIPPTVLESAAKVVEPLFSDEDDAPFAPDVQASKGLGAPTTPRDEVTLLALQSRYNCFHRGFFRACALLNHSCEANAAMKYIPGRSLTMHNHVPNDVPTMSIGVVTLVTCRRIEKGEPITVKYLSDFDFILGVGPRRDLLAASWLFRCSCTRCQADMRPEAQTEWVRCTGPDGGDAFAHLPTAPETGTPWAEELAQHQGQCTAGGPARTMPPETRKELHDIRLEAQQMTASAGPMFKIEPYHHTAYELRRRIHRLCHPAHWLHAIVLYQFCVVMQRKVDELFQLVSKESITAESASGQLGLNNFEAPFTPRAFAAAEPSERLNVLGAFIELEHRLLPFYPEDQLWAVHVAIVRMAILLAVVNNARFDDVVPIIKAKAPHLPGSLRPVALGMLRAGGIPSKQLKALSKVL